MSVRNDGSDSSNVVLKEFKYSWFSTTKNKIIIGACVLVILVLGFMLIWHFTHGAPKLTSNQKTEVQNNIDSEEQATTQYSGNNKNDTEATTYANLAESLAMSGQCSESQQALDRAQQFASSDMEQGLQSTSQIVKSYCH